MRSITKLFGAVGSLADSLLALASLVDTISGRLRLHLASETEPPPLAHEVLESDSPTDTKLSPSAKRNRKSTAE